MEAHLLKSVGPPVSSQNGFSASWLSELKFERRPAARRLHQTRRIQRPRQRHLTDPPHLIMPTPYHPPFTLTPCQVTRVAEIGERLRRLGEQDLSLSPQLRKANRIQSILTDQVSNHVKPLLWAFGSDGELNLL